MANMEFQQYLEDFSLGITRVFEDELQMHERTYTAFLREETVSRWFDTEWLVSGLGIMPEKGIGAAFNTDRLIKGPTKQHALQAWGLSVSIDYEAIEFDIYGIFKGLPEELARSSTDRYNVVGHALLNNSFSAPSASYQIYSGENMISTSHTRLDGGTWQNQVTGNPGLSYLAYQQARILLLKMVNERGSFRKMSPRLLITSVEQEWIANELVMSRARPDQSNPAVYNSMTSMNTYSSPFLTTAQYWWLESDKRQVNFGLRLGRKPTMERDSDIRTRALTMTAYCSFSVRVFDSRGLVGSTGGA